MAVEAPTRPVGIDDPYSDIGRNGSVAVEQSPTPFNDDPYSDIGIIPDTKETEKAATGSLTPRTPVDDPYSDIGNEATPTAAKALDDLAATPPPVADAGLEPATTHPPADFLDIFEHETANNMNQSLQGLFRGIADFARDDRQKKPLHDVADALEDYRVNKLLPSFGVSESDLKTTKGAVAGAAATVFDIAPGPAVMITKMAAQSYNEGFKAGMEQAKATGETDEAKLRHAGEVSGRKQVAIMAPILAAYAAGAKVAGAVTNKLVPEAGGIVRGVVGSVGASLTNLGVSAGTRLAQGQQFLGDLRQNLTDVFFGIHGGGAAAIKGEQNAIQKPGAKSEVPPVSKPEKNVEGDISGVGSSDRGLQITGKSEAPAGSEKPASETPAAPTETLKAEDLPPRIENPELKAKIMRGEELTTEEQLQVDASRDRANQLNSLDSNEAAKLEGRDWDEWERTHGVTEPHTSDEVLDATRLLRAQELRGESLDRQQEQAHRILSARKDADLKRIRENNPELTEEEAQAKADERKEFNEENAHLFDYAEERLAATLEKPTAPPELIAVADANGFRYDSSVEHTTGPHAGQTFHTFSYAGPEGKNTTLQIRDGITAEEFQNKIAASKKTMSISEPPKEGGGKTETTVAPQGATVLSKPKPEVMGFGPGPASIEEPLPKYEARKFATRLQADEALLQELKDAAGNRYYEPISNKITAAEAKAVIEERGIAQSINLIQDEANGVDFRTRIAVGELIIKRLNEASRGLQKTSLTEATLLIHRAADLAEWGAELGTRLGQGVQAFRMWSALTPEGKLLAVTRMVRKTRDKFVQSEGDKIKKVVEGAKAGTEKATGGDKQDAKTEAKIDKMVKREQDKIARQLSDTPTWAKKALAKKNEILALIRAHLKKEQDNFVERMTDFEVDQDLAESIDRMALENRRRIDVISGAKERANRAAKFDRAADKIAEQLSDTPSFRAKGDADPAKALIREHLKRPQPNFIKRLVEFGADKATAETIDRLAKENRERILKVDRAKRAEELRRQLTGTRKLTKRLKRADWEKIVELADHGLLTDQSFIEATAERLGLPVFTEENRSEVLRLAGEIELAAEGDPRNQLILKLNAYIANLKGFNASDVPIGYYYGNMLSGYNTQFVNTVDTFLNVGHEINGMAISNPKAAARIYSGMLRGFKEGRLDFLLALTEGRMVTDAKYLEIPRLMEVAKFGQKGGVPIRVKGKPSAFIKAVSESKPGYILNGWKYVTRLMAASDSIMFRAAKEARMSLLMDRVARGEGLRGRELVNRVNELLGLDEKSTVDFKAQAESEGYKGVKAKFRIAELRELARPKEANADAADFAGEATYNHEPHGVLGYFASGAAKLTTDLPAGKLVIPFTRIVANVTNRGLNNTPWGFKRAFYGYGIGKTREAAPTGDAQQQMITRAVLGTMGLSVMLGLHAAGKIRIHGDGPTDRERRRQLLNAGWKPYSVQIGNGYYSYIYTPIGLGLSLLGNMLDATEYKELGHKDALTRAGYTLSRLGSTIFSQSFLSGTSTFFRLLSGAPGDVIASAKQFFASTVGTITTPSILRDMKRLYDPKVYQSDTIMGDMLRNTVFASIINKPALNAFGEPVTYPASRFYSELKDDPAWRFVVKHGVRVSVPDKYTELSDGDGGKRRITPEEYYRYLRDSGQEMKQAILQNMDEWGDLDHDEIQDRMSKEGARIRKRVKAQLDSD